MKNKILLLILFLYLLISNSCSNKIIADISCKSNNILYKNVVNVIEIKPIKDKKIEVIIKNGKILKIENYKYSLILNDSTNAFITIKQGKKKQTETFRIIQLPKFEIRFLTDGNGDINNITSSELRNCRGISFYLAGFDNSCWFKLKNIDIKKINKDNIEEKYNFSENKDISNIMRNAKKGDVFIFSNINFMETTTEETVIGDNFTIYVQ